jgi:hypothetical protein
MNSTATMGKTIDTDTLRAQLQLIHADGKVFEVRLPDYSDHPDGLYASTVSGYFNDIDAAVSEINKWMSKGTAPGVFFTLNPMSSKLLAGGVAWHFEPVGRCLYGTSPHPPQIRR